MFGFTTSEEPAKPFPAMAQNKRDKVKADRTRKNIVDSEQWRKKNVTLHILVNHVYPLQSYYLHQIR